MESEGERQHEVTRLEGFSDAVFGFALTLLVVQLEAPRTTDGLRLLVQGSVPFALTFAMVCYIWWEHNRYFRNYGLQDAWTAFLNSLLLFVVLFYVYPLKFLTMAVVGPLVGLPRTDMADGRFVMLVYSAGVVLIFGTFVLLYRHAWSRRRALALTPAGELRLRYKTRAHQLSTALGVVSLAVAAVVPEERVWIAGVLYGLMGPLHAWNGYRAGVAHARLAAVPAGAQAERG
jgi:uncharacterized membrane protein